MGSGEWGVGHGKEKTRLRGRKVKTGCKLSPYLPIPSSPSPQSPVTSPHSPLTTPHSLTTQTR
ncbi:hypothetical protein H1Q63_11495 [Desmonostoc muscorum CCALA 125]|nr:hypothetical protein [Desmonostoc muscorum CCALA 125]